MWPRLCRHDRKGHLQRGESHNFPTATHRKQSFYTQPHQLRKALKSLGIPVAARTVRIKKGRKEVMRLNSSALLQVNRTKDGCFHWVCFDGETKRILDPMITLLNGSAFSELC